MSASARRRWAGSRSGSSRACRRPVSAAGHRDPRRGPLAMDARASPHPVAFRLAPTRDRAPGLSDGQPVLRPLLLAGGAVLGAGRQLGAPAPPASGPALASFVPAAMVLALTSFFIVNTVRARTARDADGLAATIATVEAGTTPDAGDPPPGRRRPRSPSRAAGVSRPGSPSTTPSPDGSALRDPLRPAGNDPRRHSALRKSGGLAPVFARPGPVAAGADRRRRRCRARRRHVPRAGASSGGAADAPPDRFGTFTVYRRRGD